MQVSVVDLRYKMNDVLKALDRNEEVRILYHGKLKGIIKPQNDHQTTSKVTEHSFFNMNTSDKTVSEEMDTLRGGRYIDDI